MGATDVNVTEFKGNATNLVKAVNQIDAASKNLDATLTSVLSHIQAIENGLKNVKNITNNAKNITNNVNAKNNTNTFDFGSQKYIVKGSAGFMGSDTGREQAFKDYQQAVIKETKEITADIAERKRLRKQRADAETKSAGAASLRASRLEDQTSARYLDRMDKLAEARMLNAKNNQAGALNRDPRYQASRAIVGVGNVVSTWGTGGKIVGSILDSVGSLIKAGPAGAATAVINLAKGITDLGKASIQAFSEIESIKTQLGIVYSSQTQANTAFGELSQYAVHSPFGIQQTSELAVLLKQSGVYASDLMDTLRMLGDTAGGNMEKMKRIANNYAQIVSIGKASMLDMRQFAYAGIPIFEAVSKELGVSQQELRKLISDGKVTSDIIEKVFKDLTGINGIFENATEIGAKTLKARLQNLADARQLAQASVGEWVMNLGTKAGGDSFGLRLVDFAEKIYQDIHENIDTRNIEKSVKTIEERENRIQELQALVDKYANQPEMLNILQQALKVQVDKRDVEKDRSIYEASYQNKVGNRDALLSLSRDSLSKYESLLDALTGQGKMTIQGLKAERTKGLLFGGLGLVGAGIAQGELSQIYKRFEDMGFDLKEIEKMNSDERKEVINVIKEAIKALKGVTDLTEEEIRAHRETLIIDAQQLAYDKASKASGIKGSYTEGFEELFSLYRDSDEYKEKETKARIDFLKEAKEMLKELLKYADKEGNIDITKMTYDTFVKYLDEEKRVLNEGTKLTLVENDKRSEKQLTEDRKIFTAQWSKVSDDIDSLLRSSGNYQAADEMLNYLQSYDLSGDNTSYFRNMNIILEAQNGLLEDLYKNTNDKRFLDMQTALWGSTFKYQQGKEGLNGNPEDLLKGATQEFIPLWKRILSSATGLTTNGMTGTQQTMENYRDDMAIRNMTAGVLSATMKSIGVDTAMGLMKTNNAVQLAGDSGKTFQVDWLATKKAVKDFALQLSASTEVVTAYKNGLQAELDTYEKLIAAGYTEAESTDLGSQKFVSTKQLQKLALGNSSQLVNAFGEVLETASGKKYKTSEIEFKNGEMFDKFGNKIEEEVVVTGKLFEFIKGEMPRLREELHEATAQQLNNEALNKMLKEVLPTQYSTMALQSGASIEQLGFLLNNPDYIQSYLDSKITALKGTVAYSELKDKSNEDILLKGMQGEATQEKLVKRFDELERAINIAKENGVDTSLLEKEQDKIIEEMKMLIPETNLLTEAFEALGLNVSALTDNDDFANLSLMLQNLSKTQTLNADITRIKMYDAGKTDAYGRDSSNPLNYPDRKRAERNDFWSLMGFDLAYDKEDFFVAAARAGLVEGKSFDENDTAETILDSLTDTEKESLSIKKIWLDVGETMENATKSLSASLRDFAKGSFLVPFEALGKYLATGEDQAEGMKQAMKDLTAETLSAVGATMVNTGFQIAGRAAMEGNWTVAAAGLALAAAGGVASGLGSALKEGINEKDKSDKEREKLESLKDDLTKLLDQARRDALYYENNLRHKTALGTNERFSYQSVHDAVITPKGDVITTDPKDYLIATKTPQQFAGGGNVTVSPVINCNVVNNSNAQVRQEQTQNPDGSIDIITIIEEVAGGYIASSRSDEAFGARNARMNGRQVVM